jgi:hypothetical protein
MSTTTLLQFKTRARDASDMGGSLFVSDDELTIYVNSSAQELYDLLVASFTDLYTVKSSSQTPTTTAALTLPADFYKLRGVDYQISSSEWVDVQQFSFQERNNNNSLALGSFNRMQDIRYRLTGSSILLTPENKALNNTFRMWYVPVMSELVDDTDTFDGINGWEQYIVIDAAIKMLNKEESDSSNLVLQKKQLKERIQAMAQNRDSANPEVILPSTKGYQWWGY